MALPESVRRLIDAARRRLTVIGLLSTVAAAVALAGAVAAALLGLSRVTVILWAEPVAWGLIGAAGLFAAVRAFLRRPSRLGVGTPRCARGGRPRPSRAASTSAIGTRSSHG